MYTFIKPEQIPADPLMLDLCRLPFNGNRNGCPNFEHKKGCPPYLQDTSHIDLRKGIWVIFTGYKVGEFAERMRQNHPEWPEKVYPGDLPDNRGDVELIEQKLRNSHPEWPEEYFPERYSGQWLSRRNWYNPRLWQPTARALHRADIAEFQSFHPDLEISQWPESREEIILKGLMWNVGVKLSYQWPPAHDITNTTYRISIAGTIA